MKSTVSTNAATARIQMPTAHVLSRWGLCAVGVLLSLYALYVETSKESNPDYTAMCDIGSSISCSKVFTSKYGRGFGIIGPIFGKHHILNQPNSIFGILFYVLQMAVGRIHTLSAANFLIMTSILSNFGSVYLGYILYCILEDACVVCISTYVVNALLLLVNILKWTYLRKTLTKKKE